VSRKDVQNATLDWAETASPVSDDSPFAKFDYLKLRETLEAIVAAMEEAAQPTEPPLKQEQETGSTIRLVVSNDEPESAESLALEGSEKPAA
jgi:hypothetical protein